MAEGLVWRNVRMAVSDQGDLVIDVNGHVRVVPAEQAAVLVAAMRLIFEKLDGSAVPQSNGRTREVRQSRRAKADYFQALATFIDRDDQSFTSSDMAQVLDEDEGAGVKTFLYRARQKGYIEAVIPGARPTVYRVTDVGRTEIAKYARTSA